MTITQLFAIRRRVRRKKHDPNGPCCYLIHFDRPIGLERKPVQHYLGAAVNLSKRLYHHRNNSGAKILRFLNQQNVGWNVVRIWHDPDPFQLEHDLKAGKNSRKLCPICSRKE